MRVFYNLLRNAIKYHDPNEKYKYVRISASNEDDRILINFEDNGVGVPVGEESLIFEKFKRGSNARIVFPEGTGLGLAYCKSIMQKHGGFIRLDRGNISKPTVFIIEYPLNFERLLL